MPIVDSIDFTQFNDGTGSYGRPTGLAYSDSLNTWRRKTNGIINYVDTLIPFLDFVGGDGGLRILSQDEGDRHEGDLVFTGNVTVNGSLLFRNISANTLQGIPIGVGSEEPPAHDDVLVYNDLGETPIFDLTKKPKSFQGPFIDLGATFDPAGSDSSNFDNTDSQADRTAVQEIYVRNTGKRADDIIIFAEGPYYGENGIVSLCVSPDYSVPTGTGGSIYYPGDLHILQSVRLQGWNDRAHYGNFQLVGRITVPIGVTEISARIISYAAGWNPEVDTSPWTEDSDHYFMGDNPVRFVLYSSDNIEQITRPE